jgi:hypothetical protein
MTPIGSTSSNIRRAIEFIGLTLTGSSGVEVAHPSIHELCDQYSLTDAAMIIAPLETSPGGKMFTRRRRRYRAVKQRAYHCQ